MNSRRTFQIAIIGILSIFLISTTWASTTGRTVILESTAKHPDASGAAVIDQDHVSVQARGLKPDSIHGVVCQHETE